MDEQEDREELTAYFMGERMDPPTIEALRARSDGFTDGLTDGAKALWRTEDLLEFHLQLREEHETLKEAFNTLVNYIDQRWEMSSDLRCP